MALSATSNQSILNINSTTSIASGVAFGFGLGKSNVINSGSYNSILNGTGNTSSNNFVLIGNGRLNTISNSYSTILNGNICSVSGIKSTVVNGSINTVGGNYSTILNGQDGKINGTGGLIGNGLSNKIYSNFSSVLNGWFNNISIPGTYSTIINGRLNSITALRGFIGGAGDSNVVSASNGSVLTGWNNEAAHSYATVFGRGAKSRFAGDFVFGYGSGAANVANNKFRVDTTGQIFAVSTSISLGSDYAEYLRWKDDNKNNEDRKGYFVSLDKDTIVISNENIVGIISTNPAIIADAADFEWVGAEIKNIWGEVQYDTYSVYSKDKNTIYENDEGKLFVEVPNKSNVNGISFSANTFDDKENYIKSVIKVPQLNPLYDPSKEYIPRSQRKEYAAVGLLGKLFVKTSEKITSTKIDAGSDGMAKNGTKYHVLKHVKEYTPGSYGVVQVLFK